MQRHRALALLLGEDVLLLSFWLCCELFPLRLLLDLSILLARDECL